MITMLPVRAFVCAGLIFVINGCGNSGESGSSYHSATTTSDYGPNPELTPGLLCSRTDVDFDGLRYEQQIPHCRRHVTSEDKQQIGATYHLSQDEFHLYEFDHYIPLSIGGSNSALNVWPLKKNLAREKSRYEQQLFDNVAGGHLTQAQAVLNIKAWQPSSNL